MLFYCAYNMLYIISVVLNDQAKVGVDIVHFFKSTTLFSDLWTTECSHENVVF